MARVCFLLTFVLAMIGCSMGSGSESKDSRVVSTTEHKPSDYDSFVADMTAKLQNIEELTEAQKLYELDESSNGNIEGDDENCYTNVTVKRLYTITTKDNSSHIIVQTKNFAQKFKWSECYGKNNKCFQTIFRNSIEITTQCGEIYGAVSLYVYNPKTHLLEYRMFEIPIACACKFKQNTD